MSDFMRDVKSKTAKEVGRATGHREKIWGRPYRHQVLSDEPKIQIERLQYLMSNGPKEGLCLHPLDWPGFKALDGWRNGGKMEGHWINRTRQYEAFQRGDDRNVEKFKEPETVVLSPLPCLKNHSVEEVKNTLMSMAKEIEKETIARHQTEGTVPIGSHAVCRASPFDKPINIDRSPSGLFHATGQHYAILIEAFKLFVNTYRDAAEKLKAGKLNVRFPPGAFPPPRPIVFASALLAPD